MSLFDTFVYFWGLAIAALIIVVMIYVVIVGFLRLRQHLAVTKVSEGMRGQDHPDWYRLTETQQPERKQ